MARAKKKAKPKPEKETEVIYKHRRCDAPGCTNVVTHWLQEVGYTGPVYCLGHGHLAEARR